MADDKPIIIIKKKGGHGGHHGGAWKVAYADFVTAMMAFFMVMWLINSAEVVTKQSIASYFRKPGIFESGSGTPLMMGEAGILQDGYVPPHPEDTKQRHRGSSKEKLQGKSGTDSETTGDKRVSYKGEEGKKDSVPDDDIAQRGFQTDQPDDITQAKDLGKNEKNSGPDKIAGGVVKDAMEAAALAAKAAEKAALERAAEELKEQVLSSPQLQELIGLVDVKVDADGLRIEIMDTAKTSMFQSGSARLTSDAESAFAQLTPIIAQLPNKIDIVGHTDSQPFSSRVGGYSNWELSADRANAARRIIESQGIPASRIISVTGRADRDPRVVEDSLAPSNRRITLKLRFSDTPLKSAGIQGPRGPTVKQPEIEQEEIAEFVEPTPEGPQPFSAKDILADQRRKRTRVKLPDAPVPTTNPPPAGKDKVFGDSPVIGPNDPFASWP